MSDITVFLVFSLLLQLVLDENSNNKVRVSNHLYRIPFEE